MTIPDHLTGAWQRVGLVLDGVRAVETLDVLWLQSPEWYADIRLRTGPRLPSSGNEPSGPWSTASAFAGPARWLHPLMTWVHTFDSSGQQPSVDAGHLSGDADILVETGETAVGAGRVRYTERWRRVGDGPATVEHRDGGVCVSVARWRIEISDRRPAGAFTAARFEAGEIEWVETGRLVVPAAV